MNVGLEQDLHKCPDLLSENWNSQNNKEDVTPLDCMSQINQNRKNSEDSSFILGAIVRLSEKPAALAIGSSHKNSVPDEKKKLERDMRCKKRV